MDIGRAYLLCGSEEYLINYNKKRLLETLSVRPDDMNFTGFSGSSLDLSALSDAIMTMPFFAERRVVLVEGSGLFKSASEPFLHILESIPETTVLVFAEKNVDKRYAPYKYFKKNYIVNEYDMLTGPDLEKWAIGRKLGGAGLKITQDVWQTFLSITTADKKMNNMSNLNNELEKLISYCHGKDRVEMGDVYAITSGYSGDSIFALLDAIASGDKAAVMRSYHEMLLSDPEPEKIIHMILWEFRGLYSAGELYSEGMSNVEIAKRTGMYEWQVKKHGNAGHFKSFPPKRARSAIERATGVLRDIRRGSMDSKIGAELLIMELTTKNRTPS